MPKYRVLMNGRNFLVAFDREPPVGTGRYREATITSRSKTERAALGWYGFYTNVFVTAATPQEAEQKAVQILIKDAKIRKITCNPKKLNPRLYALEIEEIRSFRGCLRPRQGLAFYSSRKPKAASSAKRRK